MHVDRLVLVLVLRAIVHATEEHEPGVLRLSKPLLAEHGSAREGAAGMCVLRDTPRVRELARREGVVAVRFGVATGAERRGADGEARLVVGGRSLPIRARVLTRRERDSPFAARVLAASKRVRSSVAAVAALAEREREVVGHDASAAERSRRVCVVDAAPGARRDRVVPIDSRTAADRNRTVARDARRTNECAGSNSASELKLISIRDKPSHHAAGIRSWRWAGRAIGSAALFAGTCGFRFRRCS